jgi:hypothetical protein
VRQRGASSDGSGAANSVAANDGDHLTRTRSPRDGGGSKKTDDAQDGLANVRHRRRQVSDAEPGVASDAEPHGDDVSSAESCSGVGSRGRRRADVDAPGPSDRTLSKGPMVKLGRGPIRRRHSRMLPTSFCRRSLSSRSFLFGCAEIVDCQVTRGRDVSGPWPHRGWCGCLTTSLPPSVSMLCRIFQCSPRCARPPRWRLLISANEAFGQRSFWRGASVTSIRSSIHSRGASDPGQIRIR